MFRSLLINYTGRKGAGPAIALETAKAFMENGYKVIALVSSYAENLEQWKSLPLEKLIVIKTYKDKISFIFSTLSLLLFRRYKIKRIVNRYHIDFVYCPMACLLNFLLNPIFKKYPVISVDHDPIPHKGDKDFKLIEKSYLTSSIILVHSKKFVGYVKNKYNKPCYYIPLGRHDVYKTIANKRYIIQYDETKQNFLFFGRISQYKGLDNLYKAYKKLEKENDNVNLVVAGNGDFSLYLENYKSLNHCQIINKWIDDEELESLFKCKNLICVLPYNDATQSGVVLVAMDYGIPVIVTNTGGLAEQVEDGKTGLIISPNNEIELYDSMKKLSKDKKLYDYISENQKKFIETLSWKNIAKQISVIFEKEVNKE